MDYYEEKRKQEEENTYRNEFGFIIEPRKVSLAYASGSMDSESIRKFEANNKCLALVIKMRNSEEPKKLGPSFDIADLLNNSGLK
jgi:hypothetical protein